jgi:hypothetical protein
MYSIYLATKGGIDTPSRIIIWINIDNLRGPLLPLSPLAPFSLSRYFRSEQELGQPILD